MYLLIYPIQHPNQLSFHPLEYSSRPFPHIYSTHPLSLSQTGVLFQVTALTQSVLDQPPRSLDLILLSCYSVQLQATILPHAFSIIHYYSTLQSSIPPLAHSQSTETALPHTKYHMTRIYIHISIYSYILLVSYPTLALWGEYLQDYYPLDSST